MSETASPAVNSTHTATPPPSYLDAAVKALIESCQVQMGLELVSEWAPLETDSTDHLQGAAIDLGTEGGAWRMYVYCPDATVGHMARVMFDLPEDEEPEAEDMEDCLCEVVNISAGYLKSLDQELASYELRLPGFLVPENRPDDLKFDSEDRARRLRGGDNIELLTTFVWQEES